ncbi:MFS transporter [Clostridium weizhouense]|uniref:MFS transporter n=1 Tax=Clostridium weizhouense TaxID=2859781 RepID=A0ABS7AQD3_9CLOT|nr:MFS transporter [Clostridium weizhouense]MBW6410882.1 MFS transporter [Clostridium weizhouense]
MKLIDNKIKLILNTYSGLPVEVYILFICKMINCMGAFVYPLLSLILTQKIGFSIEDAGFFVTFTAFFQAPCMLLGGKLVDTIGRKKVLLIFQTLGAFCFIICGFLNPSYTLAKFIMCASCFYSIANPAYDSIIGDITTKENRKASFSLIYMGLNLGFAIGPLVGGLLFKNHLKILFIGDAFTTLISIILIRYFIKETYRKNYTLEKAEHGSIFKVILKRPILISYSLLMLIFQFAYSQWGFAIPIQLETLFGDNGAQYFGFLGSCNGIIVLLFTPLITVLTQKYNLLSIIATGGILYAISFGCCSFISKLSAFFIIVVIMTIGEVFIATNSGTFINNLTPSSHRGRMNSLLPLIYGSGYTLGPTIMGKLINSIGLSDAWLIIGITTCISAILMYFSNYTNKINYKNF